MRFGGFFRFNTQPPEGGCGQDKPEKRNITVFQHTATRRWLHKLRPLHFQLSFVSTHSHPKVAAGDAIYKLSKDNVSTHSHPKVAAVTVPLFLLIYHRFNTQPPEGGCMLEMNLLLIWTLVSTHSHPKVAAIFKLTALVVDYVSTHSHPKVAAVTKRIYNVVTNVSTHSHPKVAAVQAIWIFMIYLSFNTQPPEGGCFTQLSQNLTMGSFNTQPPEGGCTNFA